MVNRSLNLALFSFPIHHALKPSVPLPRLRIILLFAGRLNIHHLKGWLFLLLEPPAKPHVGRQLSAFALVIGSVRITKQLLMGHHVAQVGGVPIAFGTLARFPFGRANGPGGRGTDNGGILLAWKAAHVLAKSFHLRPSLAMMVYYGNDPPIA